MFPTPVDDAGAAPTCTWIKAGTAVPVLRWVACALGLLLVWPVFSGPAAAQSGVRLIVENPVAADRADEVVSVPWRALADRLPELASERVRVVGFGSGEELPVQALDADGDGSVDSLLFLASFRASETRLFYVQAVAPEHSFPSRAHVAHDARRDDVAWENDRVAFRTYGKGLAALEPLVSSGIDVWLKRTPDLVVDRWYADGHYHEDTGEGADFFSVGPTLGAGGTAVFRNGELLPAPNFSGYRLLADGPLRAMVELRYAPRDVDGLQVAETRRITIDAGSPVYRQETVFSAPGVESVPFAAGLVSRDGLVWSTRTEEGWTWLSGWGPVANNGHGDLGTAILLPENLVLGIAEPEGHAVLHGNAPAGKAVTHYVGAGWTSAGVRDAEAWWSELNARARRLAHPLRVRIADAPLDASRALGRATGDLRPFLDDSVDADRIPRSVENGVLRAGPSTEWTSGFYPGMLWYLYEFTGDPAYADAARRWTALVEPEKRNAGTHDMGFKVYNSFGNGLRLTNDPHYRDVVLESARTLMTRFDPTVGAIRSWDWGKWEFPVIIDNMMNLELLFAATRLTGDSTFYDAAVQHARTTLANHFRDDASSYHVVDYDTLTGQAKRKMTHQGYNDASAWSRGQAWALYGFTMTYRETGDPAFLAQARRVADFILNHPRLPEDGIPYWDFDAPAIPKEPRDASAAAIMASALYELSGFVGPDEAARYRSAADLMLASLASNAYRAPDGTPGPFLLTHSTGSMPGGFEVDGPLIYADYYYLEALLRRLQLSAD